MSSLNKYKKLNKCIAMVLVVVTCVLYIPFDIYKAADSSTALIKDYTMYSGAWNIVGPSRNSTSQLINETIVGWENDNNNYFTLKNSSGTFYPPDELCKFTFKIYAKLSTTASGDLTMKSSCRPYVVYDGKRYEAIQVDGVFVCSFYAQGNSSDGVISVPVQFDVSVLDNSSSSSSYSLSFDISRVTFSCWSVVEEEETLFNTMIGYLEEMAGDNETIKSYLSSIKSSSSTISSRLNTLNTYASGILSGVNALTTEMQELQSLVEVTNDYLSKIKTELEEQTDELKAQTGILNVITGWLSDIYDGLFENNNADKNQDFDKESKDQSGQLNGLIGDMQFEKPDIEDVNISVEQYISFDDVATVGNLLSILTNYEVIKIFLLVSFTVALVGYGLFGKR